MWSPSELKRIVKRSIQRVRPLSSQAIAETLLDLQLEELIAMRGRNAGFMRNQRMHGFRFGDLASRRRGIGLELDSVGPYQWGDDIRHMDWFATARTGRPQVKQFRHDVQQTVVLVVDLRPSMMFGSTSKLMAKTACLAAAKVAWSTSKDHQPLGLLLLTGNGPAEFTPPRRGRRARLQHLARVVEAYKRALDFVGKPLIPLADMLDGLPSRMSSDVEAVIISDFSDPGTDFDLRLRETAARGSVSAIMIEDELMTAPPPAGLYPIVGGDHQLPATVAIRDSDTNVYRERAEANRRALMARLSSLGVRQVLISDAQSIDEGYFR